MGVGTRRRHQRARMRMNKYVTMSTDNECAAIGIKFDRGCQMRFIPYGYIQMENGNFKRLQELLATGIDPTSENNLGRTSLHAAARGGHLKIITELLTNGVSVNQEDDSGVTPLHIAIEKSKVGATYALLDAGANC